MLVVAPARSSTSRGFSISTCSNPSVIRIATLSPVMLSITSPIISECLPISQSGIPIGDTGDCGPVRVFQSLRQGGYESIMHKAGHRHGDGSLFSRRQEQPVVLESKRQFETHRFKCFC